MKERVHVPRPLDDEILSCSFQFVGLCVLNLFIYVCYSPKCRWVC